MNNKDLKPIMDVLAKRGPLSPEEVALLKMTAQQLKAEIDKDKLASQGLGGVLGGAAASILFGPFAVLPIIAAGIAGAAFGKHTHQEAYKQKQELLARIIARLSCERQ